MYIEVLRLFNLFTFTQKQRTIYLLVKYNMQDKNEQKWDGKTERRNPENCRRRSDRRTYTERRYDSRKAKNPNRNFYGWIRSLTHSRLGVDRRQQGDQRIIANRRAPVRPSAMLTKEEIADLLS